MNNASGASAPPNGASEPGGATLTRTLRSSLPPTLPAGTVLRDRYRLTGTLKIGRVGTIYRAEGIETNRAVMVKIFHEVGRNDWNRIQSFHRPTSSRVPRPEPPSAFVAVHDCDLTNQGQLFLVTESVQGLSVEDLVRQTPPLAPARALELATRIGEALEAALNLGLLDLPLTPGDIIVDDAGRVKLLWSDALMLRQLGLADQLAAAEAPERDPRYTSPEELVGLPATERSAVYRFGVLLYELLCGSPPFEGTTRAEVRDRQRQPPPRRLRDRHRALPASLDRLVLQMIDPDPMMRPVDPTSILNELWEAACRLRPEAPVAPAHAATSSGSPASGAPVQRSRTRPWALVVIGGALLAWPHLVRSPTTPISVPVLMHPAVVASPPPPVISRRVPGFHPPDLPPPAVEPPPAAPTADSGASLPPRVGNMAPVDRSATPAESPPAPDGKAARQGTAPVGGPPSPARSVQAPAPRPSTARVEPEPTPARTIPTPPSEPVPTVPTPPVRPSQPATEDPRAGDPTAIIEWLVRESPRAAKYPARGAP